MAVGCVNPVVRMQPLASLTEVREYVVVTVGLGFGLNGELWLIFG